MDKQNRNRLIDTKNVLIVAKWEDFRRMDIKGAEIKKYKLVVIE